MRGPNVDLLEVIVRCLHERYTKKCQPHSVNLESSSSYGLCIVWRYTKHPFDIYFRLIFNGMIVAQIRAGDILWSMNRKVRGPKWVGRGSVLYEDPEMQVKLDLLVTQCLKETIGLEADMSDSNA